MRYLVLTLLAVLTVLQPVIAVESLTFQDPWEATQVSTAVLNIDAHYYTTSSVSWVNGTDKNSYLSSSGNTWCGSGPEAFILNKNPTPITYAAVNWVSSTAGSTGCYYSTCNWKPTNMIIRFYDVSGIKQGTDLVVVHGGASVSQVGAPTYPTNFRVEVKVLGGTGYVYKDGVLVANQSRPMSLNPYYIGFGTSYTCQSCTCKGAIGVDDAIWGGTATDAHIFGQPATGYYLYKDAANSAASGLYNSLGAQVNSFNMTSTWGTSRSGTTNTIILKELTTDTVVSSYTAQYGNQSGSVVWDLPTAFFNNPKAPYGVYVVTIPGTGVVSTPVAYLGGGGTVFWDQRLYTPRSTGAITYGFLGDSWDTNTYTYSLDIMDAFGEVVHTSALSQQNGRVYYTFTDGQSHGVYYAVLKMTPKSGGDDIWANYDHAELVSYVFFSGYVMDAEDGHLLSGAQVNITQLSTTQTISSTDQGWNSTSGWLPGATIRINTSYPGYGPDFRLFTPVSPKTIPLNISLLSSDTGHSGVSVGGIVRDDIYGNPISNATYHVRNTTEYSALTNIAGYARVDYLVAGTLYDVWGSKEGYGNSSIEKILVVNA